MKKLYYATFIPGMERAVEGLLRREGGVTVRAHARRRGALPQCAGADIALCASQFFGIDALHGMADVDAAIKKLLATGDWLDRIPYEQVRDKRFRIVTMDRDKLVPVNMRYLNMLEKAIIEQTGMKTLRERPDLELWIRTAQRGG